MPKRRVFENGYQPSEEYPEYINHWFYFPAEPQAEVAARQLRARGWNTEIIFAHDGAWLALATQPARGDEDTEPLYDELMAFAERLGGVYDGYERPADEPEPGPVN